MSATSFKLEGIDTPELRASATMFGVVARLTLVGTAEMPSKLALDALLKRLHARCLHVGVQEVAADIRRLEFMDTSCFKTFVSWVSSIRDLDAASQYKIVFLSDVKRRWQSRSVGALACLAVGLITIQT